MGIRERFKYDPLHAIDEPGSFASARRREATLPTTRYTVYLSVGSAVELPYRWTGGGTSIESVIEAVLDWLLSAPWHTIYVRDAAVDKYFTFKTEFVSDFYVKES